MAKGRIARDSSLCFISANCKLQTDLRSLRLNGAANRLYVGRIGILTIFDGVDGVDHVVRGHILRLLCIVVDGAVIADDAFAIDQVYLWACDQHRTVDILPGLHPGDTRMGSPSLRREPSFLQSCHLA